MQRGSLHVLRAVAVLLIVFAASGLTPRRAFACSCVPITPAAARDQADAVFFGRLLAAPEDWPTLYQRPEFPFIGWSSPNRAREVTLAVSEVWKGPSFDRLTVKLDDSMCEQFFTVGDEYMIYAMDSPNGLYRTVCQRAVSGAMAQADRFDLGPGAPPAQQAPAPPPSAWPAVGLIFAALLVGGVLLILRRRRTI